MTDEITIGTLTFTREQNSGMSISTENEHVGYCEGIYDSDWTEFVRAAQPTATAKRSGKLTATDEQVIDALRFGYENVSTSVTPLAVWRILFERGQTDTQTLLAVRDRLNALRREGKIRRHKQTGSHGGPYSYYRPNGAPLPMFSKEN